MDLPQIGALEELEQVLSSFLRKNERILLCFPGTWEPVGKAVAGYVESAGSIPLFWGEDLRWKTLLHKGFRERCSTVIGPPQIVLGLSKLSHWSGIPLYIRNAVLLGDTRDDQLLDDIRVGLDCEVPCWIEGEARTVREDTGVRELVRELRGWTTILDLELEHMGRGLSLEMITFPGEKLPKLPSFARLVVRNWDADRDTPLDMPWQWKNSIFSHNDH